jgi:hypothetical protein
LVASNKMSRRANSANSNCNTSMKFLILLLLLTSCGSIGAVVGTSTTSYETYKTVTYAKGAVDLGLSASGKKTTDDRMLSSITGYDCKVTRVLKEGLTAICKSIVPMYDSE